MPSVSTKVKSVLPVGTPAKRVANAPQAAPAPNSIQSGIIDTVNTQELAQTPQGGPALASASNKWATKVSNWGPIVTVVAGVAVILATFVSFKKVKL